MNKKIKRQTTLKTKKNKKLLFLRTLKLKVYLKITIIFLEKLFPKVLYSLMIIIIKVYLIIIILIIFSKKMIQNRKINRAFFLIKVNLNPYLTNHLQICFNKKIQRHNYFNKQLTMQMMMKRLKRKKIFKESIKQPNQKRLNNNIHLISLSVKKQKNLKQMIVMILLKEVC